MSEPQPPKGAETNVEHKPASAGLESLVAVGARLAQLREARNWSVADVSARLKVATPKLRALEAGDISQMPGAAFAVGVVRSYAKMLGVDPEPFAQALRRQQGIPEVDLSMPASAGSDLPRGRVSIPLGGTSRHRSWLWAGLAIVVAIIAVAMWHTGGDSSNWLARFKSNTGATQPASAVAVSPAAASDSASAVVAGGTVSVAAGSDAAVNTTQSTTAPVTSAASSETSAAAGVPVSSSALVAPAAPAVASAVAPVAAASAPANGASTVVAAAGQSTLGITVKQDCWVSVRDKNGKELVSALVKAGETKQVAGDVPLRVTVGNRAGLDSVTFDGKSVDPAKYAAGRGNVARFALP